MKQKTPDHRLLVQLRVYALALLLALFVSALHAGVLFASLTSFWYSGNG
jgi:hypothetical protein